MASLSPRARLVTWSTVALLGGGAVAGAVVSQLGIATAASPSPSPSAGPQQHGGPLGLFGGRPGRLGLRGLGGGGGLGALGDIGGPGGRVLHGQATVQTPGGGTIVVSAQTGTITTVEGSQLTVKSSDGFSRSYVVDKNTRIALNGTDGALSSLKSGDTVRVVALQSGSTWNARGVLDGNPPAGPFGHGFGKQGKRSAPAPSAAA